MTDVQEFLEHHGVKGQKWGIRNDRGHQGERAKTKKIAKLDKKFANPKFLSLSIQLHNRAAELTNKNDISRINNKPQYKNKDFTRDTPLRQKYYKEHQQAFVDNVQRAADELGTNASGTQKYRIVENSNGDWSAVLENIKHAGNDTINIKVNRDLKGYITSLEIIDAARHGIDQVQSFLEHHGVKGQKWGIRRDRKTGVRPLAKTLDESRFGKASKANAERHNAKKSSRNKNRVNKSTDHKNATDLRKRKVSSLTNKQIQSVNNRANLETKFKQVKAARTQAKIDAVEALVSAVGVGITVAKWARSPEGRAFISAGADFIRNR